MTYSIMKLRVHGNLRIYVTTAENYYKMISYAHGKKWKIIYAQHENNKTVYQCEQIHKKFVMKMELDNEEEAENKK